MARVTYGSIITELRGSVGGTTFQKNKYGHTAKNKGIPTKAGTSIQYTRRNTLLHIVQAWNSLTDAERTLWVTYAATYPQPIKANVGIMLSGYNLFVKYNAIRLTAVGALWSTPIIQNVTFPTLIPLIKWDASAHSLYFYDGSPTTDPNITIHVSLSSPIKQSIGISKNKTRYTFLTSEGYDQININSQYLAIFGSFPLIGDRIFVICRMFHEYTPAIATPQSFILTVTAV